MANAERLDRLLVTLAEKMPSDGTTEMAPKEEQLEHEEIGSSIMINDGEMLGVRNHHRSDESGHLADTSPAVEPSTTPPPPPTTPSCQECMPYCRQV